MNGHPTFGALQFQVFREFGAQILPTTVGTKSFDFCVELGCQPAFKRLIRVKCVRLRLLEIELGIASIVISERSIVTTVSACLDGRWTPQVSVNLVSIKSEDLGGGDIPCVCLGGTQMQTGDTNGSRGQTDWLDNQTDELRGQMYVLNQSNNTEMAGISHGDSAGTYLGAGDAKCGVEVTNGVESQTDMLIGRGDVPSVETDPNKPAKAPENVSITRKKDKPPNLPMEAARQHSNELNACGDQTDTPIAHTDMHTIGDETKTAENEMEIVSTQRNSPKT